MLKVYGAFRSAYFEHTHACAGCVSRERYFTGTKVLAYWYKRTWLLVQKDLLTGTKVQVLTCKRYKSAYVSIRQHTSQHTSAYVSILVSTCTNTDMQGICDTFAVTNATRDGGFDICVQVQKYLLTSTNVLAYWYKSTRVKFSRQVNATRDGGFDICVQFLPLSLLVQNYNVSSESYNSHARWRVRCLCACMLTYADVC